MQAITIQAITILAITIQATTIQAITLHDIKIDRYLATARWNICNIIILIIREVSRAQSCRYKYVIVWPKKVDNGPELCNCGTRVALA